ncbi:MAG: hypothetical protein Q8898_05260 [Bacillota bacterium]|nr:hypothetical protein [Bacillota bacterium]
MDKYKNGRTITIKLNGTEKIYPEPQVNGYEDDLYTNNNDIEAFDDEQSYVETAAAEEKAEESFDWILPENTDNDLSEYKIVKPETKQKLQKPSYSFDKKKNDAYKSIVFAVLIAVLVGISFGFIMLKLVISDHPTKQANTAVIEDNHSVPLEQNKNSNVKLKPFSTFVIQEGVYSSKESAGQAASIATAKGVPAQVMQIDGKEYLFLGTDVNKEHAKSIGSEYVKKGLKIYAKQITIPEKTLQNVTNDEQHLFERNFSIYSDIAGAAASALNNEVPSKEAIKRITDFSTEFSKIDKMNFKNSSIKQLGKELLMASQEMVSYRNVNDREIAIKSQQHLLKFLTIYNSI